MKRLFYTGYLAGMAGLFLLCAGCKRQEVLFTSPDTEENRSMEETGSSEAEGEGKSGEAGESKPSVICVYVCGQVEKPGVYELLEGSRIADAVEAAGGMKEEAADTYLNLAESVTDGQKIEVPSREEAREQKEAALQEESGKVNLNTATAEQLMTLTGIGESKARDILAYREQRGSFQSIEELKEISGIKDGVFQKIKDQITV